MKVLVLCGPESTGKSCLAQALAAQFGAQVVHEYVREFIEQQQRDTCLADIPAIARGQLTAEDTARAALPRLLVLDTHLLSNHLWSTTLFGQSPAWLLDALQSRHYDLHLLLSPHGMPWQADGQRCQPLLAEREAFFSASETWLRQQHQPYAVLSGSWEDRLAEAFKQVERLLEA